ncbi:prostaglandin E receptor 1c (subtype EP1) [Aplochiton taeniatus]
MTGVHHLYHTMDYYASPSSKNHHYRQADINSSACPTCPWTTTVGTLASVTPSSLKLSCLTMTLGALSNLAALGILAKSRARFGRQAKAPFVQLIKALLLADLGGHVIPGAFALYLHLGQSQRQMVTGLATGPNREFCQLFGASLVFFGLCSLLLGCAMAAERCVGITQPFLHTSLITVHHICLAILLLTCLALLLAVLPLLNVGRYTVQFPGTWCFLPFQGPRTSSDATLALAFSVLGLTSLALSLLCNTLSGLALLQARASSKGFRPSTAEHGGRPVSSYSSSSSSSSSYSLHSLDVEMMVQLALITVVSCVCWSPFLILLFLSAERFFSGSIQSMHQSDWMILLGLRLASWNQILDPWVYILLRRAVLRRLCRIFRQTADAV